MEKARDAVELVFHGFHPSYLVVEVFHLLDIGIYYRR